MTSISVLPDRAVTAESDWVCFVGHLPELAISTRPVVVVAAHPDDETLAVGGLLASLAAREVAVDVLAVSDGEASHLVAARPPSRRRAEQDDACRALGLCRQVERLGLPDVGVPENVDALTTALEARCNPDTVLIAPWDGDGHDDHDACGWAARRVASSTGATLLAYPVWAWQWAEVGDLADLPLRKVTLDAKARQFKAAAIECYRSKRTDDRGGSILGPDTLRRSVRPWEVVIHVQ